MLSLFLTIPLTFISIIGPVLNGCVVIAIILTRQISSVNHILLLHLGILNLILGTLYLIFLVPSFTVDNWITSGTLCTIFGFSFTLFHPLVVWTICGLNCDRYYAIASPLHYGHIVNRKKLFIGLSTGWIICVGLCVPPFLQIVPYGYIEGLPACISSQKTGNGVLVYSTIYTIFTLLIPATLIICCNLKILMIARYHRHRIASAIYEVTLSAQVTITHQRNPFFVPTVTAPNSGGPPKFKGKSAIHTVFQLLGSFFVLYFPYYVLVIWQALAETLSKSGKSIKVHPYLYTTASTLLIFSIPINGFLYGVKNKTLRKTFQNYLRKKQTKSEVNQEIQARTPSTCGSRRPSLTPLGFFTRPTLQRRLSEALLDVQKNITSPQKSKIKRIASDIAWRPYSNSSLNISPKEETRNILKQTISCNTLQVPADSDPVSVITEDETSPKTKTSPTRSSTAQLFFHKLFTIGDQQEKNEKRAAVVRDVLEATPKKSPRILITRAFSEESDKTSKPNSPLREISRKHSSSSTSLIEKKWRQIRYKYEESEGDSSKMNTTKPLLDNIYGNRDSDSSETSDTSSGKIFMSLDNKKLVMDGETHEEHLLLSWPLEKKFVKADVRRKNLLKQTLVNVQSHEIVL